MVVLLVVLVVTMTTGGGTVVEQAQGVLVIVSIVVWVVQLSVQLEVQVDVTGTTGAYSVPRPAARGSIDMRLIGYVFFLLCAVALSNPTLECILIRHG